VGPLQAASQLAGGAEPRVRVGVAERPGQLGVNPGTLSLGEVVGDVAALVKP
jgi:hypothetical protein